MEIVDYDANENAQAAGIQFTENVSAVRGGESMLFTPQRQSILSVKRIKEGMIAVLSDPDLMYNMQLGDVSATLTERTELLTQLEFDMLEAVIGHSGEVMPARP
jgi:hypothetical protein